ncbi:carbonic anhydrase, partial [Dietzia maris]
MPHTNPISAWASLRDGNHRFVDCEMRHPSQNTQRREQLVAAQHPKAVLFGCSDSRVAAEIIFDQGLGDLFVIRTAGHIIDTAVLGSIEYAVHVLDTPLIVVLGHDSCGAVKATVDALATGEIPPGFLRDVVEKVSPSILNGRREGLSSIDDFEARHVLETGELLQQR